MASSSADPPATGEYTSMDNSSVEPTCGHNEIIDAVLGIEHEDDNNDNATAGGHSKPNKKSGMFGASSNLINYILGA